MKSNVLELINDSKSILILTHEKPDGDAIGSLLGLYHILTDYGKDVTMVVPEVPRIFNFLPGIDKVVNKSDKKFDLGIVVDCSSDVRIGQNNNEIANCKKVAVIDHHVSNTLYGDVDIRMRYILLCLHHYLRETK